VPKSVPSHANFFVILRKPLIFSQKNVWDFFDQTNRPRNPSEISDCFPKFRTENVRRIVEKVYKRHQYPRFLVPLHPEKEKIAE